MLRVCHVNLARDFRGGERQTELLIRALAKQGVPQAIVCRQSGSLASKLKDVPNLEIILSGKYFDPRLGGHKAVSRRFDVIQAHENRAAQWALWHYVWYKTPFVITRRVPEQVRENIFNRFMYKKASAVVSISNAIAEVMDPIIGSGVKQALIPSVCSEIKPDLKRSAEIKQQYQDRFIVIQVGALVDRHKGQSVLIDAARMLKQEIPQLLVLFLGDGPDLDKLQAKAASLNCTVFAGYHENVADYIAAADVFAFPSNYEGLGSTIIDAMQLQVPVIATSVGGIPDLVNGEENGILIPRGDAKALAKAILRLYHDPELKAELVKAAKVTADQHTPEVMAQNYLKLYQQIL